MSKEFQAQVIEAEQRLRQAQISSDVRVLDELVAPELIFTSHFGQLVHKEEELVFHRSDVLRLKEAVPSEEYSQRHEGFAVISASCTW